MTKARDGFDIRTAPVWVVAGLGVSGAVVLLHSDTMEAAAPHRAQAQLLGITLYCTMFVLWGIVAHRPRLGVWLTLAALSSSSVLADAWLGLPGVLVLLALVTVLAAAALDLRAAAIASTANIALLVLVHRVAPTFLTSAPEATIYAICLAMGLAAAIYTPIYRILDWAWGNYQEAQQLVAEARDRRAELETALSDLEHANRQLALDNQRMVALRTLADEAQRSKTAFVSRVSHEFRAPLNMIIGLVDMMVNRPEIYGEELPPDLKGDLDIIYRNSSHLSAMINDVLDLSQTETGRLTLHRENVDLGELAGDAAQAISPLIEKKRLKLVQQVPPGMASVSCDATRIRQVLLNLMSNAARFTEEGSVTLRMTERDCDVIVEVADTGPGIAREVQDHIFEPFYRATETSQKVPGTGLGLSISREIIRHHGGSIWLESEPGQGATFRFTLPKAAPAPPLARPGHQIVQDWIWHEPEFRTNRSVDATALTRPRVIVQDADGTLAACLGHGGNRVEIVATQDAEGSLAALQACPAHAIIVNTGDQDTPVGDEVERLRHRGGSTQAKDVGWSGGFLRTTPIVACAVPNPLARAREAGADGYIVKPISREGLLRAINALPGPTRSVLIIDDDPEGLAMMSRLLTLHDATLRIDTAATGAAALAALRHNVPDLILLDVVLPDTNGWRLLADIRDLPALQKVPVLFVSAQDPNDAPPVSDFIFATMEGGIPASKLVHCSLQISRALLSPPESVPATSD